MSKPEVEYVLLGRAAPKLRVKVDTLRQWIHDGCPHVNYGTDKAPLYAVDVSIASAWSKARVGHRPESRAALNVWRRRRGERTC